MPLHLKAHDGDHRTNEMRMTITCNLSCSPDFCLFVYHKGQSRWGKTRMPGVSMRCHYRYCLQCVEWCAVIGWADLLHSAEQGHWRLLRFGKKGENWQNNTTNIGFCVKLKIDFSILTRYDTDFSNFFLNAVYRVLEPNSSYIYIYIYIYIQYIHVHKYISIMRHFSCKKLTEITLDCLIVL